MEKQELVDLGVYFQDREMEACFGIGILQHSWKTSWTWRLMHLAHAFSNQRTTVALCWFMSMTSLQLDVESLSTSSSSVWDQNMRCRRLSWKSLVMNSSSWSVAWYCSMIIYRLVIQTHHKHVEQMCKLLGLNKKPQRKKTPGHSDMDQCDNTGELSPESARNFRTRVGILLYLAADFPPCQHVVRHLATYSTQPTVKSMTVYSNTWSVFLRVMRRFVSLWIEMAWKKPWNFPPIQQHRAWRGLHWQGLCFR